MSDKNNEIFQFTDIQEKKSYEFYSQDLRMVGVVSLPDEAGKASCTYIISFKNNSKQFLVTRKTFKLALRLIERSKNND